MVLSRLQFAQRVPSRDGRSGLTILELLVAMVIVGTLTAFALPAISRARGAAQRVTCINHLHNVAVAMTQFDLTHRRLPASGVWGRDEQQRSTRHESWAVSLLPWVDQKNQFDALQLDRPIDDPVNATVRRAHVPVYLCPADISQSDAETADLSYAVNGGIGFTVKHRQVTDCPVTTNWEPFDLDGDGSACSGDELRDNQDRDRFKHLGLFFLETVDKEISERHYTLGDITDGLSQTYLVGENVRVGHNPEIADDLGFADPSPYRTTFFIGNPCGGPACRPGQVDYSRSNAGEFRINSGLWEPEGSSPVPNAFHDGGVHLSFADGRVEFLSESIDGGVHAALASPRGVLLAEELLAQQVVGGVP